MTAKKALAYAVERIGYYAPHDTLPGSEAGRWMAKRTGEAWLAGSSTTVWWCMCFASMCVYEGGGELPGGPSYNTDVSVRAAREAGRLVPVDKAEPGDLAIFDWNMATANTDHVGIVESNPHNGTLVCIEGNTSPGTAGSQSAGNGVWRRVRALKYVRYVIRPKWDEEKPAQVTKPAASATRLEVDGVFGRLSTMEAQRQCGTVADGEIWGQSQRWRQRLYALTSVTRWDETGSALVKALQAKCGLKASDVDGVLGPQSIQALQGKLGVEQDGWFGTETAKALQQALNRGDVKSW